MKDNPVSNWTDDTSSQPQNSVEDSAASASSVSWDLHKHSWVDLTTNLVVSLIFLFKQYGLVVLLSQALNQNELHVGLTFPWYFMSASGYVVQLPSNSREFLADSRGKGFIVWTILVFVLAFVVMPMLFPYLTSTKIGYTTSEKSYLFLIQMLVHYIAFVIDGIFFFDREGLNFILHAIKFVFLTVAITLNNGIYIGVVFWTIILASFQLTELNRVLIFGVAYPLVKLIALQLVQIVTRIAHDVSHLTDNQKSTMESSFIYGVNFAFNVAPLYGMFIYWQDYQLFILQFVLHATISKIGWIVYHPYVDNRINFVKSKLQKNGKKIRTTLIKVVSNDKTTTNNGEAPEDSEGDKIAKFIKALRLKGVSVLSREYGEILSLSTAAIVSFPWIGEYFFLSKGTMAFDFATWALCVFPIAYLYDKVLSIVGLHLILRSGVNLNVGWLKQQHVRDSLIWALAWAGLTMTLSLASKSSQ